MGSWTGSNWRGLAVVVLLTSACGQESSPPIFFAAPVQPPESRGDDAGDLASADDASVQSLNPDPMPTSPIAASQAAFGWVEGDLPEPPAGVLDAGAQPPTTAPRLLHQCWQIDQQLPPGVEQRVFPQDNGDWLAVFDGEQSADNGRQGLASSMNGGVYLAYAMGTSGIVHELDAEGSVQWSRHWRGTDGLPLVLIELPTGDVLVGGEYIPQNANCDGTAESQRRAYLTRFTSEGEEVWTYSFGGERAFNRVMTLAIGPGGLVYAGGQISGAVELGNGVALPDTHNTNQFLLAFDLEGPTVQWARSLGNLIKYGDGPWLASTQNDNVIAVGTTDQGFAIRFDPAGNVVWAKWLPDASMVRPSVDALGYSWMSLTQWVPSRKDWLVRLDPMGEQDVAYPLVSPVGGIYRLWGMLPDPERGNLVVANYGMATDSSATQAMVLQVLSVEPGEAAIELDAFDLWQAAASNPVHLSNGAVVISGDFIWPSSFGLDLYPIAKLGLNNLFVLRRDL